MRKLFLAVWFGALMVLLGCYWHGLPALGQAQDAEDFPVLAGAITVLPWLVGPGLSALLQRTAPAGINLPHAGYWFAEPRRAASLERLSACIDAMAILLVLFLCSLLGFDLWHGQQGLRTPPGWQLAAAGVFVLLTSLWTLLLMRAFPPPPPTR